MLRDVELIAIYNYQDETPILALVSYHQRFYLAFYTFYSEINKFGYLLGSLDRDQFHILADRQIDIRTFFEHNVLIKFLYTDSASVRCIDVSIHYFINNLPPYGYYLMS